MGLARTSRGPRHHDPFPKLQERSRRKTKLCVLEQQGQFPECAALKGFKSWKKSDNRRLCLETRTGDFPEPGDWTRGTTVWVCYKKETRGDHDETVTCHFPGTRTIRFSYKQEGTEPSNASSSLHSGLPAPSFECHQTLRHASNTKICARPAHDKSET